MSARKALFAAVDLGTNSVKLLVARAGARGGVEAVHQEVVITRIGEGLAKSRRLSPAAAKRTLATLEGFARTAERLGAERVRAVATSALRDAAEGPAFVEDLRRRTGWEIEVISGDREAALGFLGAAVGIRLRGPRAVFDVGGGSAQVSAGSATVAWARSFPLGAVRLTERFLPAHPVPEADLDALRGHVRETLEPVRRAFSGKPRPAVVGIGGTVACLTSLHLSASAPATKLAHEDLQGRTLTRATVERLLGELAQRSIGERKRMPGMDPGRADVIAAGAATVAGILEALDARELRVSTFGIRYGLLVEMAREG